jgi:hypothetical protein
MEHIPRKRSVLFNTNEFASVTNSTLSFIFIFLKCSCALKVTLCHEKSYPKLASVLLHHELYGFLSLSHLLCARHKSVFELDLWQKEQAIEEASCLEQIRRSAN